MTPKLVLSIALTVVLVVSALGAIVLSQPLGNNRSSSLSSSGPGTSSSSGPPASTTTLLSSTTTLSSITTFIAPPSFYVATDGSDSWTGTLSSPNSKGTDGPFASIVRAQAAVRSLRAVQPSRDTPVVIEVEGGTYFLTSPLTFTSADSGTPNSEVVYEAQPGTTVVISGGQRITGWSQIAPNVWSASASGLQPFEQLWVNNQRILPPRTTTGTYLYVARTVYSSQKTGNCSVQAGTRYECFDRFQFNKGDLNSSYYDMNDVQIIDFECWTVSRLRLSSVDTANDTAFMTGPTSKDASCHGFIAGHEYLVENVREALRQPGEWFLDEPNMKLLYYAGPGENPNAESFIAPQLDELVSANSLSRVSFVGLTFSNSNWLVPQAGWPSPQGEELSSHVVVPAALNFTQSSYITVQNCTISHIGDYALSFTGTGPFQPTRADPYSNQVVGTEIYDTGAGGIIVGRAPASTDTDSNVAQYVLIENDAIFGIGRFLPGAVGVYVLNAHNNLIIHNDIHDTYSNAVSVGGTYTYNIHLPQLAHDNVVEFNLAYDINQGVTEDGGGLYTAVGDARGNEILNNVVHDVTADVNSTIHGYGGWGIYFDSTSQNVVAKNNLVYRTSFPSIHQNDGFNNTVTNNILAYGEFGVIDRTHNNASSLFVTHNVIYWDISSSQGSFQGGLWTCTGSCPSQFLFADNLYWYAGGAPAFITTNGNSPNPALHDLAGWQGLGEDIGSIIADPKFASPGYPTDNYNLASNSPAFNIGFVPFDPGLAGRLPGSGPEAQPVPVAFPLHLLSLLTGF